jgi:large subunit ribosomal protein L29
MKSEKVLKPDQIREMTDDDLKAKEREISDHIFRLRFQFAGGQTDLLQNIRVLKKNLARVKTLRRDREVAAARKAS